MRTGRAILLLSLLIALAAALPMASWRRSPSISPGTDLCSTRDHATYFPLARRRERGHFLANRRLFDGGAAAIHAISKGERLRIGKIDPACVADTNEPPKLTPELAAAHSWTPDAATGQAIKHHSVDRAATVTVSGFRAGAPAAVSRGTVAIRTSTDRVGAPIFYRDMPLTPSKLEKGVI